MLLNKQVNELHQVIVRSQLDPTEFIIVNEPNKFSILLINSAYAFYLFKMREGLGLDSTPNTIAGRRGNGSSEGWREDPVSFAYSWDAVILHFNKWVQLLAEDALTPNIWSKSYRQNQPHDFIYHSNDEIFSELEADKLRSQLNQLHYEFESSTTLPKAAIETLTSIIQEALNRVNNSTKSGFNSWFAQTLIAALVSLALNPTQTQEVLKLLKAAFGGLFLH